MKFLNVAGIKTFYKILINEPKYFIPKKKVNDIRDIDFKKLKELGFKGIVFDKDNTLTYPNQDNIHPIIEDAFIKCLNIFGRKNVVIFSNSAGSYDDKLYQNAKRIEEMIGIKVLQHGTKKPSGFTYVKTYFHNVNPENLLMIGDRYFTDIVFGNKNGLYTICTDQLTIEGESFYSQKIIKLEKYFIKLIRKRIQN